MTENFLKFKRKIQNERILKSLLAGAALGGLLGGVALILSKLTIVGFAPIVALPITLGVFLLAAAAMYFLLRTSDKKLAEDLDARFALQEKVQTMVAYRDEKGDMLELQRRDAEDALAKISIDQFKPKYLLAYILAACIGLGSIASGFIVENKRKALLQGPPFSISAIQIAGIEELIRYVDASEMEELYRVALSSHLTDLLADLKGANTEAEMQTELAESMAYIQATTYASSSMTEIANALWNTQDEYAQTFAQALDTSAWTDPDWGDYAEKMTALREAFDYREDENISTEENGDTTETEPPSEALLFKLLQYNLETTAIKINMALTESGVEQDNPLYTATYRFAYADDGLIENTDHLFGLGNIIKNMAGFTIYNLALLELDNTFKIMGEEIYDVIAQQKINTNVGEYTMKKLSTLFLVPLPEFERPDFSKSENNENAGAEDDEDDNGPSDGGIGEGATYGSDDLVLDPMTGEYVEYGVLLDKYYAVMYEKLENGNYTEEQKEIIKNYFSLLYSGIEKEEGN